MRTAATTPGRRVLLLVALGAMSAFGPLSIDLYLPGLPRLGAALGVTESQTQWTISAFMIGLALGQLVAGAASDRMGRRIPLLIGCGLFVIASAGCAVAPDITTLMIARIVQGLAGAAGMVISRAVVRDLYDEAEAGRVFSRLMLVTGVAPIVAPLVGGVLLIVMDWRGLFVVLAVVGIVLFLAAALLIPESLDEKNRHVSGLAAQLRDMGLLFKSRSFIGYTLIAGIGGCTFFVYLSMSSIVLQSEYGVSAIQFSLIFAANAIGIVLVSQINASVINRLGLHRLLVIALVVAAVAAAATIVSAILALGIMYLLVPVFIVVAMQGVVAPNTTALALAPFARGAGAAAAVLGTGQILIGAVVPPLVSLGGTSAVVMGAGMLSCAIIALLMLFVMTRTGAVGNADRAAVAPDPSPVS